MVNDSHRDPTRQRRSAYHPALECVVWTQGQALIASLDVLRAVPEPITGLLTLASPPLGYYQNEDPAFVHGTVRRMCVVAQKAPETPDPTYPVTATIHRPDVSPPRPVLHAVGPVIAVGWRRGEACPLTLREIAWWMERGHWQPESACWTLLIPPTVSTPAP